MKKNIEFGISTFADVMPDPHTGVTISQAERIRQVVDDILLSDELGIDFYGVGEHHRKEFAVSSPAIVLAAAAGKTKHITLGIAGWAWCIYRIISFVWFRPQSIRFIV